MSLLSSASNNSIWRGYDYFKANKVRKLEKISDTRFTASVAGNEKEPYITTIDLEHLRQSSCNCPHAAGRRVICKHMVALYFAVFPDEGEKLYASALAYEEEEEKRQEELARKLPKYIHSLKKAELEQKLLNLLYTGPEWQYDRFIREKLED